MRRARVVALAGLSLLFATQVLVDFVWQFRRRTPEPALATVLSVLPPGSAGIQQFILGPPQRSDANADLHVVAFQKRWWQKPDDAGFSLLVFVDGAPALFSPKAPEVRSQPVTVPRFHRRDGDGAVGELFIACPTQSRCQRVIVVDNFALTLTAARKGMPRAPFRVLGVLGALAFWGGVAWLVARRASLAELVAGGGLFIGLMCVWLSEHRYATHMSSGLIAVAPVALASPRLLRPVVEALRRRASALSGVHPLVLLVGLPVRGALLAAVAVSGAYLATVAFGLVRGYAFPNTAALTLLPQLRALAVSEPALPYVVLAIAAVGALSGWAAAAFRVGADRYQREERAIARVWVWSAPVLITAVYLFSVAGPWAGVQRSGDYGGVAIAGYVPFSDAWGHFAGPLRQVMEGPFDSFVERRLVAAATRSAVALLTLYSASAFLLLQVTVLALATAISARALTRWRGPWAGLAFFGLVYLQLRPYLPTFLTEPLGVLWSLAAVPIVIRSLRLSSLTAATAALALTCLSQLTRSGSLFTIPALVLWMLWVGYREGRGLARVGAMIALVLACCGGLALGLHRLYGSGKSVPAANFSHVLCGLAHGGTWDVCERLYARELASAPTEAEAARFRLSRAVETVAREPRLLLGRLLEGERYFSRNVLDAALLGYFMRPPPAAFPVRFWQALAVSGCLWILWRRRERYEASFWLLTATGLLASAPWVIFDDGWRVLSGSFPLIALLLACGFTWSAGRVEPEEDQGRSRKVLLAVCVFAVGALLAPGLARRLDLIHWRELENQTPAPGEIWIVGGARMAALLVVPDAAPLPVTVPALHYGDFERAVQASGVEYYQKFLEPELQSREFAFVAAAGIGSPGSIFLAPSEVVRNQSVGAWRLKRRDMVPRYFLHTDWASPLTPLPSGPAVPAR